MSPTKKHVNKCPNYKKLYGDNQKTLMEEREKNLILNTELKQLEKDYIRVMTENRELKEDNHFKDDQIEHDNKYQDELIKCNDSSCNDCRSLFIWTIAMAGITISALGWAYITWSMR